MVSVSRTFTVDKPADQVVAYLSDFAHTEQWDPGTTSCTRADSGPIAVGAHWKNVSKFMGREVELDYRMERFDPDRVVFVGTNKGAQATDDITVRAQGPGSELTYRANVELKGVAKFASPLVKVAFEKIADETVEKMTGVLNAL